MHKTRPQATFIAGRNLILAPALDLALWIGAAKVGFNLLIIKFLWMSPEPLKRSPMWRTTSYLSTIYLLCLRTLGSRHNV